jgi:hypothetical protein
MITLEPTADSDAALLGNACGFPTEVPPGESQRLCPAYARGGTLEP